MATILAYDHDHVLLDSFKPMPSPVMVPEMLVGIS
jgi:hypothetical protein